MRPFGALIFGRIGDLVGRKYTFLVTIVVMGVATFAVGLLPTFAQIGWLAPVLLVTLRLLQGLALGGEYGGAATYVAEHAPAERARLHHELHPDHGDARLLPGAAGDRTVPLSTSTATTFADWGWRIPFLVSLILLAFSVYIRLKLNESPVFQKMKAEGKGSKAPLTESFLRYPNNKIRAACAPRRHRRPGRRLVHGPVLCAVLPDHHAQARLSHGLCPDRRSSLLIGTPFFIFFGWLSDRIGRLKIILAGCADRGGDLLPAVRGADALRQPGAGVVPAEAPDHGLRRPATCNFHIFVGPWSKFSECDRAQDFLTKAGLSFTLAWTHAGQPVVGRDRRDQAARAGTPRSGRPRSPRRDIRQAADPKQDQLVMVELILVIMVLYVTMVYGPIAAFLVEMFPTRIRYTSMSLPYHIGNGWFGGMLPLLATAVVAATGDIYAGLWYPIGVAVMTLIVGAIFLRDTKGVNMVTSSGVAIQKT